MKDTSEKISRDQSPAARLPDVYVGTKNGSLMVTDLPDKVALLAAALNRLSERWDLAIGRAQTKTGYKLNRTHDEIELDLHTCMPASDRQKLGEWFTARYQYLDEEYRSAINAADNIIGKQWLYDRRPKLNKELP